ncbi:hypothetical protein C8J57DRAFT_1211275 [Mycena rebaudengoi]|nr:hypothetical protein C8J57DRAFT_1211275 [Mycena rebaudengoi]
MSTIPRLPMDLERIIFEMSAYKDQRTMVHIMLVAQRCRCWYERITTLSPLGGLTELFFRIEPILYRSLVICQSSWSLSSLLRTIESRPNHYAKWIQSIRINPYFTSNDPAVARILSICTGTVHLVDLSYGRTPFSVLCGLRLQSMCISLDSIDDREEGAYFGHPAFAHLTHLQILDPPRRWPDIPFAHLPALTHLALQNYKTEIRVANAPVLKDILSGCHILEVLVVCVPLSHYGSEEAAQAMLQLVDDPRFAIVGQTFSGMHDLWLRQIQDGADDDDDVVNMQSCGRQNAYSLKSGKSVKFKKRLRTE